VSDESQARLEALLSDALRPIEPPEDLASRVETTLSAITEQAAAELSSWADELSESELESLRDPRNWVRPVAAVAAGTLAGGGGGFWPRIRSITHAPRSTGDVVVPLAVTLSTAACVISPPRGLSLVNGVRRRATPCTGGSP